MFTCEKHGVILYGSECLNCKKDDTVSKSASVSGSSAKSAKLKVQIAGILMDAIGGTKEKYRTPEGFIRWGVVEGDMNETIDAALR